MIPARSLDFSSALYLGLWHGSAALRPWSRLTSGVPFALEPPAGANELAARLARLQGCAAGVLGTSTLHLFRDLFGMLSGKNLVVYLDDRTYPVAVWGAELGAARGLSLKRFAHHDPVDLRSRVKKEGRRNFRPVVVSDGFCPHCGRVAPLAAYLEIARELGGLLILDDTQALGIFGHSPGPFFPYGKGGGGTLHRSNIADPDVLVVSSLAKGFGVPVAVLSGSQSMVRKFKEKSKTLVHCSPPSIAVIHAAEHALSINLEKGDALRLHLAGLVRRFKEELRDLGISTIGGFFPFQTLNLIPGLDAKILYKRLIRSGIRPVLHSAPNENGARISFAITARHSPQEIDMALWAVGQAAKKTQPQRKLWL